MPALDINALLGGIPGLKLRENESLSAHTSMGVGGVARALVTVEAREALAPLITELARAHVPWMMLGGGSNTIFGDEGYPGIIVTLGREFRRVEADAASGVLRAGAGAPLSAAMKAAQRAGLAGLEFSAGIPGSVGGALAGNAGTAAGEICPLARSIDVVTPGGEPRTLRRGDFDFGYRHCTLREFVIVEVELGLRPDAPQAIQARIDAALGKRWEQPLGVRCSGCMFKNPPGDYAGRLIDRAGLKGLRVGGARVSDEHANFIINDQGASARDIAELVSQVRNRVRDHSGVELELEIRLPQ